MSAYDQGPPPMQGAPAGVPQGQVPAGPGGGAVQRREGSETKAAFKTTELIAYVAAVLGVLIAAAVVGDDGDGHDGFGADRAWLYVTLLTIGYLISRGLAKAGSRHSDY